MIPAQVRDDLQRLVDLVRGSATGTGAHSPGLRRVDGQLIDVEAGDTAIADALYASWYLGLPADTATDPTRPEQSVEPPLIGSLRAAHAGTSVFEPGWVVLATLPQGGCVAGRGAEQRVAHAGEYLAPRRPAVPVAPGEQVHVTARVDTVDPSTGWWATRSPGGEPDPPLVRIYAHPDADTVAPLVRALTGALLGAGYRWSLKASTQPIGYRRPDPVVLYVCADQAEAASRAVTAAVATAGIALQPRTPPLARMLAPGLATAHDPGADTSFGTAVCRALTPGVRALACAPAGIEPLVDALTHAGWDPCAPWLGQVRP